MKNTREVPERNNHDTRSLEFRSKAPLRVMANALTRLGGHFGTLGGSNKLAEEPALFRKLTKNDITGKLNCRSETHSLHTSSNTSAHFGLATAGASTAFSQPTPPCSLILLPTSLHCFATLLRAWSAPICRRYCSDTYRL